MIHTEWYAPRFNAAGARHISGTYSMTVPPPTGLRYCINGVILDFEKANAAEKKYKEGDKKE